MEEFEANRARLFGIAYRLLGSAVEAEDAVQDTYLRWHGADRSVIEQPAAWLTKVLTNLCLTRLTSARARREQYVGQWLPEPVLTGGAFELGPLDTAELRESVSMAFLVLLERLTPAERAVFVLREAFEYSHREIADVLDLTEANCQQLYRRARDRVADDRPRFQAGDHAGITRRFLAAARGKDIAALESLLAADVVSWADGGGRTAAARNPIQGAQRVARYLAGWMSRDVDGLDIVLTEINGEPGILASVHDELLLSVSLEITDGLVTGIRLMANPDKLAYVAGQVTGTT